MSARFLVQAVLTLFCDARSMTAMTGHESHGGYSQVANTNGHSQGPSPTADAYLVVLHDAETTKGVNKVILRRGSDLRGLLKIVEERGHELDVINICTLVHRLARCLARSPSTLSANVSAVQQNRAWHQLMKLVREHAPNCNNMELTNCMWSIATMEMRHEEETMLVLLDISVKYLSSFDPRNLGLSAWALAKNGCTNKHYAWCQLWADATLNRLAEFDCRDMTMVVWAFATIHWKQEQFLYRFCEEVMVRIEKYTPQDLGNTLWALATLGFRHEGSLNALCMQCFPQAENFDQQNLSIIMWALATIQYKNMNLLHHLTQHATERIKTFRSQGMSNITWACAKFQFQQKCLLMTVAEEAIPRLDEFEPQHMAILAWAYATLEFPNRPLLTAICKAATRKMQQFGPQHIANLTWAMATLSHKDEEYLAAMCERAVEQARDFNPQECSNLAWSLALLTYRHDALLEVLSERSQEIVAEFIPQNLGNSAWAYNRLGYRAEALMRTLARQAACVLHECQGQEILDLIEAISTGGYEDVVDATDWTVINGWIIERSTAAEEFIAINANMALQFKRLSDFDRALAVQDYRDNLQSFSIIGLGYHYTSLVLRRFGVTVPEGAALDAWAATARAAAPAALNETDASKNVEAQEGLRANRTVCVYKFSLWASQEARNSGAAADVNVDPVGVVSQTAVDSWELGLVASTLKHPRGGDGEFQALQACARACYERLHLDPLAGEGAEAVGELWLHVTEVPCLSCVGAMAQFRQLFPNVLLNVSFTLGRQAVSTGDRGGPMNQGRELKNDSFVPRAPADVRAPQMTAKTYPTKPPLPSPKEPSRRSPTLSRLTNPSIIPVRAAAPTSVLPSPAQESLMTVAPRHTLVMGNSTQSDDTAVKMRNTENRWPAPEAHKPDEPPFTLRSTPNLQAAAVDGETDWDALAASLGHAAACCTSAGQPQSFY